MANIKQIQAAKQSSGGSCGYHALYNGIKIAESIDNSSLLNQCLHNSNTTYEYCESNESLWVIYIQHFRAKQLAEYYITDLILSSFKNMHTTDSPEKNSYKLNLSNGYATLKLEENSIKVARALADVTTNVARYLAKNRTLTNNTIAYDLTFDDIKNAFLKEINRRITDQSSSSIYKNLPNKINFYLPNLKSIQFSIKKDFKIKDTNTGNVIMMNWAQRNITKEKQKTCGECYLVRSCSA